MDGQTHPPLGRVTKTPTHTLTRVRNNQRRHRQRRREHTASLEQRLKDAEERLVQLQAENAALRATASPLSRETRDTASLIVPGTDIATHLTSTASSVCQEIQQFPSDARVANPGSASVASVAVQQPDLSAQEVGSECSMGSLIHDIPPFPLSPNLPVSVNPEFILPTTYLTSPSAVQSRSACCSRRSPEPSIHNEDPSWLNHRDSVCRAKMFLSPSSTTLCSQAYLIIQHHNRRQLPMEAVQRWLWPGFFGSGPSAEHGCRVDNQFLLGLLEYIAEWESFSPYRLEP